MSSTDDDARLMLQYRDGNSAAFEVLYHRHKGPLYRYLLRHVRSATVAADLFQEVWSRLVANRRRYEARAKFATYLFHIAHNCTMDYFRRDRLRRHDARTQQHESAELEVPEHQRPDRLAEFDEQQSELLAGLAMLPAEQREAFLLHAESGLNIEDIARITAVPLETAKSRLRYAVRKLQNYLRTRTQPRDIAEPAPQRALWKSTP